MSPKRAPVAVAPCSTIRIGAIPLTRWRRHLVRAVAGTVAIAAMAAVGPTAAIAAHSGDVTWVSVGTCPLAACVQVGSAMVPEPPLGGTLKLDLSGFGHLVDGRAASGRPRILEPLSLGCMTASNCIVLASDVGSGTDLVLGITDDAGKVWRLRSLFESAGGPTSVVCTSSSSCVVDAQTSSGPALARTVDAGRTWHETLTSPRLQSFDDPSCASSRHCVATASDYLANGAAAAWSDGPSGPWHLVDVNHDVDASSRVVSCETPSTCVLADVSTDETTVLFVTRDGGRTWKLVTSVPHVNYNEPAADGIQCMDGHGCVLTVTDLGRVVGSAYRIQLGGERLTPIALEGAVSEIRGPICRASTCVFVAYTQHQKGKHYWTTLSYVRVTGVWAAP